MPPKSGLRQRNATPARSTRASSILATDILNSERRSTRATSRQPTTAGDAVANPALPEIATAQSYAYGSSKAPALPDSLIAPREMNLRAVADRLDDAAIVAQRNFSARAAEVRGRTPESQSSEGSRTRARTAQEPQLRLPVENTPEETRKQNRVASWVESSELENIEEERSSLASEESVPRTQRADSEPSSFPDGSFDHSYNYEKGLRTPKLPTPPPSIITTKINSTYTSTKDFLRRSIQHCRSFCKQILESLYSWISRFLGAVQKSLKELPESSLISTITKTIFLSLGSLMLLTMCTFAVCAAHARFCSPYSTSIPAQWLDRWCGQCHSAGGHVYSPLPLNLTNTNGLDSSQLTTLLGHISYQIQHLETRLDKHIAASDPHISELVTLRTQQSLLESKLNELESKQETHINIQQTAVAGDSMSQAASPLLPAINFFSFSSGATINPRLTSPTLTYDQRSLPLRIAFAALGIQKQISHPPRTALEPWQDEGDCWCAAPPLSNKQRSLSQAAESITLAVYLPKLIYPTELVVEHFPTISSANPGIAPKDIELWADLTPMQSEWDHLHAGDLVGFGQDEDEVAAEAVKFQGWLTGKTTKMWGRVGRGRYQQQEPDESDGTSSKGRVGHVQRFSVDWNQNGAVHYSDKYLVRIRSNWGGEHTCLYRVRLHGSTVDEK